ncbi:hypothetical protein QLX08_005589 [Tetragonisca angustula]|uniref:Uncharacterized protein n=1 Tax=Tetragonisca angustula TaxID=166442 RepID=A0AAW0ZXI5_9HYME
MQQWRRRRYVTWCRGSACHHVTSDTNRSGRNFLAGESRDKEKGTRPGPPGKLPEGNSSGNHDKAVRASATGQRQGLIILESRRLLLES